MIWLMIVAAIMIILIGSIISEMMSAPRGYQDDKGFHIIKSGELPYEASLVKEATAVEFFVTEDCNGCGICKSIARGFFDNEEYVRPYLTICQPQTKDEVELLRDISSFCTNNAIREASIPELEPILLGKRKN